MLREGVDGEGYGDGGRVKDVSPGAYSAMFCRHPPRGQRQQLQQQQQEEEVAVPFILYLVRFCSSKSCKKRRRWMEEEEEEEEEEEGISTATERVCWGRPRQKAATV